MFIILYCIIYMPNWKKGVQGPQRKYVRKGRRKTTVAKQTKKNTLAINKLKKDLYAWRQYQILDLGTVDSEVSTDIVTVPNTWTGIFQAQHDSFDEIPRQYMSRNVRFRYCIQTEDSTVGNVWFNVFLVTLKSKFARQVRERTSNLTTLTHGDDFCRSGAGSVGAGQGTTNWILNPAYYKIHHSSGLQRIGQETMGAATPVTNIRDSTFHRAGIIPFKRKFKVGEHESNGFLGLDADTVSNQNILYMILLSNAGATVGENSLFKTFNYVINGQTVAGR